MEYLIVCLVSAVWAGFIAKRKGSSVLIWGMVGLVVPFLGVILAAMYRYEIDEVRRQCPTCGRIVPLHDAVCTRCGTDLDFPDVAVEPVSSAARH
ncbi:MAG: hypothetical protein QOE86_2875 [Solirubrobacteraceae bacterium]|nr:hypothetical protein [Solirubrobacteraceae bacterium]